jgi:lysylphosphatidylglycerol synthetase-like protein (DUF2156 family)
MNSSRSTRPIRVLKIAWIAIVALALIPLVVPLLIGWLIVRATISLILYILVWLCWCIRGKDILFVYSDSPVWHDYIEEHILPSIKTRSVILNWSNRRHWLRKWTLASLLFRNFAGQHEYNPLAIYFPLFWWHQTFRFRQPFKDSKHGKTETLRLVEDDFFRCIGMDRPNERVTDGRRDC